MDKFGIFQYQALIKRELLEHKNMFVLAPLLLALILFVATIWVSIRIDRDILISGVSYLAMLFNGLSPIDMAPLFMVLAIPFMVILYSSAFMYLISSLYQDRKDLSILFWQSMPVSNLKTVLSKKKK